VWTSLVDGKRPQLTHMGQLKIMGNPTRLLGGNVRFSLFGRGENNGGWSVIVRHETERGTALELRAEWRKEGSLEKGSLW